MTERTPSSRFPQIESDKDDFTEDEIDALAALSQFNQVKRSLKLSLNLKITIFISKLFRFRSHQSPDRFEMRNPNHSNRNGLSLDLLPLIATVHQPRRRTRGL